MTTRISNKDAKKLGLLPKGHKYRAVPTVVDGVRFASKKEAKRYGFLRCLERAGQITSLSLQKEWLVVIEGKRICSYLCDFSYFDGRSKTWVHEDVKGYRTPVYKLKRKLVEALYGIKIIEI